MKSWVIRYVEKDLTMIVWGHKKGRLGCRTTGSVVAFELVTMGSVLTDVGGFRPQLRLSSPNGKSTTSS